MIYIFVETVIVANTLNDYDMLAVVDNQKMYLLW